jgi:4-hydroxy-tetrahydrodipicolinate reductase
MIRAIVTGAAGRMGSQLVRAVRDAEGFELVGATERPATAAIGLDAGLAAGLGMLEVQVQDSLAKAIQKAGQKVDVVIDFTTSEASLAHAEIAAEHQVALVVGSTGFSTGAREAVARAKAAIPMVMAPNMSIGVNLLIRMAAELAEGLGPDYEAEILELHHRHKLDAPSGTAMRLAEVIAEKLGRRPEQDLVFARKGNIGERPHEQIGVQSLRGGDVVGEHTVYFIGNGERIELTHRAWSRDQFATGAVRAARWIVGKPAGLYNMQDVLGA